MKIRTQPNMPKTVTPRKYSSLLNYVELKKLGFLEIVSRLFPENLAEGEIKVDTNNEVEIETHEASKTFSVIDKYVINGTIGEKKIFEINLKVIALFESKVNPESDFLAIFEKNTLKIITYPYVRELVSGLTTKMGLPALFLPIWKVPPKSQQGHLLMPKAKE
jgi:preprotein translocase subunit SecB